MPVIEGRERRPRGSSVGKHALYAKVSPQAIAKVKAVSRALGITDAAAVELLLEEMQVDANGRPWFYDGPLAHEMDEELPITG